MQDFEHNSTGGEVVLIQGAVHSVDGSRGFGRVRSELGKLHPELARKIEDHVARKG
jgi:hypothetical protein